MRWRLAFLSLVALALSAPSPATAHGVFEASELEVHVLSDEGSDVIESYGGYDVQDLFVGFAHDATVGAGEAGDGFYVRLELYGLMENSPPRPGQAWTATVTIGTPAGPLERTLSTTDGTTLESDFQSLLYQIDSAERATHVQRAFVSYASVGLAAGQAIGPFKVETRVDGDLRDVAPGGIPVPGTDGAATYPDPTQIDGKGELMTSVPLESPAIYVQVEASPAAPGNFTIAVKSALTAGGQHIMVLPRSTEGWVYQLHGPTNAPVDANGTLTFTLDAVLPGGASPLLLEVMTDVGGRYALSLDGNGTLTLGDGTTVQPAAAAPMESPMAPWAPLAAFALALLARSGPKGKQR
ncbi:MAG: hypothetical protein QOC71_574 [Thermoplasmata archaeon]|nr:hypothetical protein [Thermoplasmata archaeon]